MSDIIQEFAAAQNQEQATETVDILKEYAESLKEATTEQTTELPDIAESTELPVQDLATTVEEPVVNTVEDFSNDNNLTFVADEPSVEDVVDEDDFISQKTGGKFSSWEDIEKRLSEEQTLQFKDEASKNIYNMLAEGRIDEVADVLQKVTFAKSVQDKPDEDILKAYIKATNPEFDSEDIKEEYNEKYTIYEYSFDESKFKREQKKLSQKIKSDVTEARQFFNKLGGEFSFPQATTTQPQEIENEVDDAIVQEERNRFLSSLNEVASRSNSIPFNWKDEKTNLSVAGKFEIPGQELSKYKAGAEDLQSYIADKYYKDGKYKADQLLRDLYVADNLDRIISSAVSQAVNQTRLETIKKSKNISTDTEHQATFRPSDSEEESDMFAKLFMGHLNRR